VSRVKPAYASIHKSGNVAINTAREKKETIDHLRSSYPRISLEQ